MLHFCLELSFFFFFRTPYVIDTAITLRVCNSFLIRHRWTAGNGHKRSLLPLLHRSPVIDDRWSIDRFGKHVFVLLLIT